MLKIIYKTNKVESFALIVETIEMAVEKISDFQDTILQCPINSSTSTSG